MSEDPSPLPPADERPPEQEAAPETIPVTVETPSEQTIEPQQSENSTETNGDLTTPVPEGWEPDANRAHYMADRDKDLRVAASMAEQVGRPEKAEELRQSADVEAQKGADEFDSKQRREAERHIIELRNEEYERRAQEERRQREDSEINELVDKVFDAVNLEPG